MLETSSARRDSSRLEHSNKAQEGNKVDVEDRAGVDNPRNEKRGPAGRFRRFGRGLGQTGVSMRSRRRIRQSRASRVAQAPGT